MDILIKKVFIIYSKIKLILLSENPDINISNIDSAKLNDFYDKLNDFYKELKTIKNNRILIQGFIDKNYSEIREIKQFLLKIKTPLSRSIHDKIFKNIFKCDNYLPLGITLVFEDFIKGITYFKKEEEYSKKNPIYHRAASCGNSSEDFRKKYLECYGRNRELAHDFWRSLELAKDSTIISSF